MALLKLDKLSVVAGGATLLDKIDLTISKGQRVGVFGEAGSGKTLLAMTLLGLLPQDATLSGAVTVDETPLTAPQTELAARRGKQIGALLPRQHGLDPLRTVGEQVLDALPPGVAADGPGLLLTECGLEAKTADRYPRDLSPAEQRRLLLAMALAPRPELLIADEPTAGLDLIEQRGLLNAIDAACAARGMALLLISHDLKALALLCSRMVVMRGGKIVESGDKSEVLGHPRHELTRAVLGAGRQRARTLMRTPIGDTLLEVRHLGRRYRQPDRSLFEPRPPLTALDDVSFSLRAGESMALIGPAGSGKSTLARIIVGLERATSGEIAFEDNVYHGTDVPRLLRRHISFVPRDPKPTFNPTHTVGESIAEPLQLEMQKTMDELGARIVEVVTAVGLHPDHLGRMPDEFPTGTLQRLAMARALVTRPRLVVLDEPIAALDVAARAQVLALLNRLRADFGLSFIVIGHDLDVMRVVADRVLVLDRGRVVESSTPAQILDRPQQPLTRQLVAAQLPDVGIVPVF